MFFVYRIPSFRMGDKVPMFDIFLLTQNWSMLMRMAPSSTLIFLIYNVPNFIVLLFWFNKIKIYTLSCAESDVVQIVGILGWVTSFSCWMFSFSRQCMT